MTEIEKAQVQAECLLKRAQEARKAYVAAQERAEQALLHVQKLREEACLAQGGHIDTGGMFYFTCKRCGWSEALSD